MPFGDNVRMAGPAETIDHLALLYIGVEKGVWTVNRWFTAIGKDGLDATQESMLKLARSDNPEKYPEFQGYGFENINFVEYMSYFTIVLNYPGYDFHDGAGTDPMWFLEKKENSSLPPPPVPVVPNKSFYGLEYTKVGGFPALRCRNYMRNGYNGEPLKAGETQGFIFNLYIRARYAQGKEDGVVLIIDPDGSNKGPRL